MIKKNQFVLIFGVKVARWRDCPKCRSKLTCEMGTYGYAARCRKCQLKKDKKEREKMIKKYKGKTAMNSSFTIGSGRKEIKAIGIDRATGRQVGITEKGERIPIENPGYNTRTDPHGWKFAGKKVRPFDSKLNTNT